MTIKTLTCIHEALLRETSRRKDLKEYTHQRWKEAEKTDADEAEKLYNFYQNALKELCNVQNALYDFENQDW